MQFFPWDGHCLARFQVFDSTRHFRIPSFYQPKSGQRGAPHIRVFGECVGVRTTSSSAVDALVKKIQRVAGVIHVVDALSDRNQAEQCARTRRTATAIE